MRRNFLTQFPQNHIERVASAYERTQFEIHLPNDLLASFASPYLRERLFIDVTIRARFIPASVAANIDIPIRAYYRRKRMPIAFIIWTGRRTGILEHRAELMFAPQHLVLRRFASLRSSVLHQNLYRHIRVGCCLMEWPELHIIQPKRTAKFGSIVSPRQAIIRS